MFIKLDGQNIVGHDYHQHDDFNTEVSESFLWDENNAYRFKYVEGQLVALTDEEKRLHPIRIANKMAEIRQERDRRLAATDYLMTSDYPISVEDKAVVITYRTALRDLPANIIDVDDFSWPNRP